MGGARLSRQPAQGTHESCGSRRAEDGDEKGGSQRECDGGHGEADDSRVDAESPLVGREGLDDEECSEQGHRNEQGDATDGGGHEESFRDQVAGELEQIGRQ